MERNKVFEIINTEREFQDKTYDASEILSSGQTRGERDLDVTAHLTLLDIYVDKAKQAWLAKGDNLPALQQIAKVAAIAVRAVERAGGSDDLLKAGLR